MSIRRGCRPVTMLAVALVAPIALTVALTVGLTALAGPAAAVATMTATANNPGVSVAQSEAFFASQINAARAAAGVPPLSVAGGMTTVARNWSGVMASGTGLAHNPNISSQIANWSWLGENVGVGYSDESLWSAFMSSPQHRDNILDPHFTELGVGVVIGSDGYLNVTQDFRRPNGAPPVGPAAAPAPPAPPAPPVAAVVAAPPVQSAAVPIAPSIPAALAPAPPPDPATVAQVALLSRITAARRAAAGTSTVRQALDFATMMTGS